MEHPKSILKKSVLPVQDSTAPAEDYPVAGKVRGKPKTKKKIAVELGDPSEDLGEDLSALGTDAEEEVTAFSAKHHFYGSGYNELADVFAAGRPAGKKRTTNSFVVQTWKI